MKTTIYLLIGILLFASCSVEKRVHLSGYNIEWKKNKHEKITQVSNLRDDSDSKISEIDTPHRQETIEEVEKEQEDNLTASINKNENLLSKKDYKAAFLITTPKTSKENIQEQSSNPLDELPEEGRSLNGLALVGFICGVLSVPLSLVPILGFILGILGLIFSAIGMGKTGPEKQKGRGLAITGLICGILGILLSIIVVIALLSYAYYY